MRFWLPVLVLAGLMGTAGSSLAAHPPDPVFAPATLAQRAGLWSNAHKVLKAHPRLIFHEGLALPAYPGFVSSNEVEHFTMAIPKNPAGLLMGFGTLINFNILAARRNAYFLAADASEEVIVAMLSFWRPLFLASKTPAEFVANSGMLELKSGETVADVFKRIERREKGSFLNLARFDETLTALVQKERISEFDRIFTLEVMKDQLLNPTLGPVECFWSLAKGALGLCRQPLLTFRNARGSIRLSSCLFDLYGAPVHEVWARDQVSFLTEKGYHHVRAVLEAGRDYYAVARLQNLRLWQRAGELARRHAVEVTDIYWSNIPPLLRSTRPEIDRVLKNAVSLLGSPRVNVYESTLAPPHSMTTRLIFAPVASD